MDRIRRRDNMAILPASPGLTVEVMVGGQPLQEIADEDVPTDDRTVIKYIEAQAGTKFAFKVTFDEPFLPVDNDIGSVIIIDGEHVESIRYSLSKLSKSHAGKVSGIYKTTGSSSVFQQFCFGNLITSKTSYQLWP